MKKQNLKFLIVLLIVVLLGALTLTALGMLDPIVFWVLAGVSAVFAFKVLPKIKQ